MLTPTVRGNIDTDLKRLVRAAASLQGIYDDSALAREVGVTPMTVWRWWEGVEPKGATLGALARVLHLDYQELAAFVYENGPTPILRPPADDRRIAELREFEDDPASSEPRHPRSARPASGAR